jgi:hypothetical protein
MTANQQAEKDAYVNFFSVIDTHDAAACTITLLPKLRIKKGKTKTITVEI